ncbi:MAG: hypothetical protein KME42_24860 [Tildeniella nuda ZEHNDER 1965/U140]|jgi:hypothetical protein|nr:hypothetical protein [Tildeniella nuda ZEHNDER 1965/U140]
MNTPLFDRAMLLKLVTVFTLIGAAAAILPIPRFDTQFNDTGFESPLQKEAAVKFSAIEQDW